MKDDDERTVPVHWPLTYALLHDADVITRWTRQSEWQKLSMRDKSIIHRRNLPSIHRHISSVLYMQSTNPTVFVVQLRSGAHGMFLARIQDNGINHFELLFAQSLADVLNTTTNDPVFESSIKPHIMRFLQL
jgi:hypothetical protein